MIRVRKLVLAIAAASSLTSGAVHALGLGEVRLQSSLNQPLVAEIELLQVRDLENNEIIPRLASAEDFNKAGVDRQYFLTDLRFTPVVKPDGKSVIRVTSNKPVREPYLNFLVEVIWPNGRLLREYTLLVDPPLYSPAPVLAPQAPVVAPVQTPVRSSVASASRPSTSAPAAGSGSSAPRSSAPAASLEGEYRTTNNDTLWEIARRVPGGSVHQAMLAIQDLNPNAFIDGNINRLKNGQVLRLPTEEQVRSRSAAEAVAQVAEQNTAWREGRSLAGSARQLDATKRSEAGAAPARAEADDQLRLVAGDAGKSTAGSDTGNAAGSSKALADKLAVTQESLDSSRRESAELKSRVSDLESQLDKLQRLIQLKDEQLAKLQAELAQQNAAAAAAAAAPATPAAEAPKPETKAPAEAAPTPTQSEAAAPDGKPAPEVSSAPAAEAEPDFNYSEEPAPAGSQAQNEQPAEQPANVVEASEETAKPAATPAKPVEQPKPAQTPVAETKAPAAPQPVQEPSLIDRLLADPTLLGLVGGGALLILLIALMFISRRNAMKEAELQEALATQSELGDEPLDFADSDLDNLSDEALADTEEAPVNAQTADPLSEADIYIAYGKFAQAAELLRSAINDEPERADLRLKLMEVYAEQGDRDGFQREENELREIGGADAQLEQLRSRYPAIAGAAGAGLATAAAADTLGDFSFDDFDNEPSQPAAPAAPSAELDDSFDLSLDDLEAELSAPSQPAAAPADDFADLSFDELPSAEPAVATEDPRFDLDLSETPAASEDPFADLDLQLDAPAETAPLADEDFMLSLDDEPTAAAPASETADLGSELDLDSALDGGELELPADFDLSVPEDNLSLDEAPLSDAESDAFLAELDDVGGELDSLAADLEAPAQEAPLAAFEPEPVAEPAPVPAADPLTSAALDGDDDFDFLSGTDETATKLDLARAYIDMGDAEGARDILDEVLSEGNDAQRNEARELLASLS